MMRTRRMGSVMAIAMCLARPVSRDCGWESGVLMPPFITCALQDRGSVEKAF
jgi:hypothetical protein